MIKKISSLFLLLLLIPLGALKRKEPNEKAQSRHIQGKVQYANDTLTSLSIQGQANLDHVLVKEAVYAQGRTKLSHTTVGGDLDVQGNLSVKHSTIQADFDVQGNVDLKHSTIEGEANIQGSLIATDTVFKTTLHLTTDNAHLTHVTAQDIHIQGVVNKSCKRGEKKCKKIYKLPMLILDGETVIHGSIIFENEDGTVRTNNDGIIWLGKKALISGKVLGGTVKSL